MSTVAEGLAFVSGAEEVSPQEMEAKDEYTITEHCGPLLDRHSKLDTPMRKNSETNVLSNNEGKTALAMCMEKGNKTAIQVLLSTVPELVNRVCISTQERIEYPLFVAVSIGNVEMIELLLSKGAKVDELSSCREFGQETAMCLAVRKNDLFITHLLLAREAKAEVVSELFSGHKVVVASILISAILAGHTAMIREVRSHCSLETEIADLGHNALTAAASQGDISVFKAIIEIMEASKTKDEISRLMNRAPMARRSVGGDPPLVAAARYGHKAVLNYILKHGHIKMELQVNRRTKETALYLAAQSGNREIVDLLLKNKADPTIESTNTKEMALHAAARVGNVDIIKALIKSLTLRLEKPHLISYHFFLADSRRRTVLWNASRYANINAMRCLLNEASQVARNLDKSIKSDESKNGKVVVGNEARKIWINRADKKHNLTPLHIACKRNLPGVVQLLLKQGATIDIECKTSLSLFHSAAPFPICLKHLLTLTDISKLINAVDKKNRTALMIASAAGSPESVALLLKKDADPRLLDKDTFSALHYACSKTNDSLFMRGSSSAQGYGACVDALLDCDMTLLARTPKTWPFLRIACANNNKPACLALLARGANPDGERLDELVTRPIHEAATKDDAVCLSLLLTRQADIFAIDHDGRTPLHLATIAGTFEGFRALIANAGNRVGALLAIRDNKDQTAAHLACRLGRLQMVARLMEVEGCLDYLKSDVHSILNDDLNYGITPIPASLRLAFLLPDTERRARALNDVPEGHTALYWSALYNQIRDCTDLLEAGADVNLAPPLSRGTPLHAAVANDLTMATNTLIHANANPNATDAAHESVLLVAAQNGSTKCIQILLESPLLHYDHSTFLNSEVDSCGRTALHFAAAHGHTEICRMLSNAGAKWTVRDMAGETAFHAACRSGKPLSPLLQMGGTDEDLKVAATDGSTVAHILAELDRSDELSGLPRDIIDQADTLGRTPLYRACMTDAVSALKVLLDFGCSTMTRAGPDAMQLGLFALEAPGSAEGFTPLHAACDADAAQCVLELIPTDAQKKKGLIQTMLVARDARGRQPLDLCCELGRHACASLLLAHNNIHETAYDSLQYLLDASTTQTTKSDFIQLFLKSSVILSRLLAPDNSTHILRRPMILATERGYDRVIAAISEAVSDLEPELHPKKKPWIAEEGPAALALACTANEDRHQVIRILLELGANPESTFIHYQTPLYEAASRNDTTTMEILLRHKARADKAGPLHVAAEKGYENVVNILLERNSNSALLPDKNGELPLHLACRDDANKAVILRLLSTRREASIKLNDQGLTPLLCACRVGAAANVQLLLERHESHKLYDLEKLIFAADGTSALHYAIVSSSLKIVRILLTSCGKLLLEAEAPISATAWLLTDSNEKRTNEAESAHKSLIMNYATTPLMVAAARGEISIMQLLLKSGAIDTEDRALTVACDIQQIEAAKILLLKGSGSLLQDAENLYSPLWLSAFRGHVSTTRLIFNHVDKNLDKRVQDESPLDIASRLGHSEVVEFLLGRGADSTTPSPQGQHTALHLAASAGKTSVVKILLKQQNPKPVDLLSSKNRDGDTPLHLAAKEGKLGALYAMLKDPCTSTLLDTPNKFGNTVLHCAVDHGRKDACVLLLLHGADRRKLKNGTTKSSPLDCAYMRAVDDPVRLVFAEVEAVEALETLGRGRQQHRQAIST